MKIKTPALYCLVLLFIATTAFARGRGEVRFAATPYLDKNLKLHLELDVDNFSRYPVREIRLYYREYSETRFKQAYLKPEGLRYLASVNLSEYDGSMVEYFFDIEYMDGSRESYPEEAPENNMLRVSLNQDIESGGGLIIISPEPDEEIFIDEFVLTVSFFQFSSIIDKERTKLYLNTWDVSRYAQVYDDFLTFAPRRVPPGRHNLRLELYDRSGRLITGRRWSFIAFQRTVPAQEQRDFSVSGNIFAETRNEELVDGLQSRNYSKLGVRLNAKTRNFSFGTRLYFSNQEENFLQPINRYTGWAQYNFWNDRYARFVGGDAYPQLSPFLMYNSFLRGFHGEMFLKFLNLDYTQGFTRRAIEGAALTDTSGTVIDTSAGTFRRNLKALRLSFGDRKSMQLGFTAVKGKDDVKSIQYGRNPEESAAFGTDLFLATPNNHFVLEGSYNLSAYNPNILDGEDEPLDSLRKNGIDIDENLYDFASKIITVNQYWIVTPAKAYQAQMRLNYFNNRFSILYRYVEDDFHSLGQPYLLRDNKGFTITDDIRLFQNQLFLNLRYRQYQNNLADTKPATTDNQTIGFNVSYFPLRNLPSLTFGYNNYQRNNDIKTADDPLRFPEDNTTNTITFSSSYMFLLSNLKNRVTLNVLNYNRNDKTASGIDNLSNTLSLILNTRYSFPLKTNLEVSLQETENTAANTSSTKLSFSSFGIGGEYKLENLLGQADNLLFGLTGRLGQVSTSVVFNTATEIRYNRSFLNGRIIYSYFPYGRISLNADLVNYTGDRRYKDYIITVRYDVSF
jgi:hypothetical protein